MKLEDLKNIIENTFPEIKIKDFSLLGSGLFGYACLVNNDTVFKVPKKIDTNKDQLKEVQVLNFLKGKLNIQIPEILYHAMSDDGRYIIAETLVSGVSYNQNLHDSYPEETKNEILQQLGRIIRNLHDIGGEPLPNRKISTYKDSIEFFNKYHNNAKILFSDAENHKIENIAKEYENISIKHPVSPVPCHADLIFHNLMFDTKAKKICGLIDFGAFHYAEPSRDMNYYWGDGAKEILKGYGNNGDKHLEFRQSFQVVCNLLSNLSENPKDKESVEHNLEVIKEYL